MTLDARDLHAEHATVTELPITKAVAAGLLKEMSSPPSILREGERLVREMLVYPGLVIPLDYNQRIALTDLGGGKQGAYVIERIPRPSLWRRIFGA